MDLHFTKLHGTGNDFILVDNYDLKIKQWDNELIKHLCEFHTGIGADGFIALEKDSKHDFRMRFFNSDGYESDMCVNGSRCLCYFAYSLGYVKNEMCFIANDGTHNAKIFDSEVEVQVNYHEVAGDKEFLRTISNIIGFNLSNAQNGRLDILHESGNCKQASISDIPLQ